MKMQYLRIIHTDNSVSWFKRRESIPSKNALKLLGITSDDVPEWIRMEEAPSDSIINTLVIERQSTSTLYQQGDEEKSS